MTDSSFSDSARNWVLTQAYTRLQQRQFDDSLKLLRGLAVLAPDDPEVLRMLSFSLLKARAHEECLEVVDKYLQCITPETDTKEIIWIQDRARNRLHQAGQDQSEAAE